MYAGVPIIAMGAIFHVGSVPLQSGSGGYLGPNDLTMNSEGLTINGEQLEMA